MFSAGDETPKYVDDVLTDEGNAFQARAAATGKARSPRVARCVDGTSSVNVDPDLRRRHDSTSDVECVLHRKLAINFHSIRRGTENNSLLKAWSCLQYDYDMATRAYDFVVTSMIRL